MKKLYSTFFIAVFLLSHGAISADITANAEQGLTKALKENSSNKLEEERDARWELTTNHPKDGFYGAMAQPYNTALNNLKNKGIIRGVKPSENTRIDQWTYLGAHNAFSSKAHGFGLYKQQNLSMTEQLNRGVRALMLDAWLANDIIRLTHGEPKYDKILRGLAGTDFFIGLFQEGMHMVKELETLKKNFFDKPENKNEVVFLILEDRIDDRNLMDKTLKDSGLASKILRPSEWDPNAKGGWPTFKWMKDNGKQIVIFSDKGKTQYIYPQWQNMYENQYGELSDEGAAKQRGSSAKYNENKRYFYLFNYFKDYAEHAFADVADFKSAIAGANKFIDKLDFNSINSNKLEKALYYSFTQGGPLISGRYPNFIFLDFVEQGTGLKIVDDINKKTSKNPNYYYKPIQQK